MQARESGSGPPRRARPRRRARARPRITSGEQARAVATVRNKPKPKPYSPPASSRSDAAQGTGARTRPPRRYTLPASHRSDAAQGRGPNSPITEVRQRDNKPMRTSSGRLSVRTFKNTDDYKAYDSRLRAKARIRAQADQQARGRAKVVTALLTDTGKARRKTIASDIRGQVRQEGEITRRRAITDFNDAATRGLQSQAVRAADRSTERKLASASYKAKRQIVREADAQRKLNPKGPKSPDVRIRTRSNRKRRAAEAKLIAKGREGTEALAQGTGREMKKLQDRDLKSGQPVRGTSSELGIIRGHERNKLRVQQAVLRKAKRKRRGGGIVQWPKNAYSELRDAVTGAVPSAIELAKVGIDTAGVVGESTQDLVRGDPLQQRRKRKRRSGAKVVPFVKEAVKAVKETSPAYALATGHPREAAGRAKERPLSALGEVTIAGGAVTKGSRVLNAASKVAHETGNVRVVNQKRTNARVLRNERSFRERVGEKLDESESKRRTRGSLKAGPVVKHRRYSGTTAVRAGQKTKDAALRAAGRDPDVASTRGGRASKHSRIIRRHTDELTRNVQHGGQSREEKAHAAVTKPQRKAGAKRSPRKRAALAWMTRHAELREGDVATVKTRLQAIRKVQSDGGSYENVRHLDALIGDVERKGERSYVMSAKARKSAEQLAQRARTSDASAVRRGQLTEEQASSTAARQGLIESGQIVTRADYETAKKSGGGEGPAPSPAFGHG